METVEIVTLIQAPRQRCFELALSVDLHQVSARQTNEKIIAGVSSGVLQLGNSVTFRARHFGIWQTLTSKITALDAPAYFCDEMQQGAFRRMRHEHHFAGNDGTTVMRDLFAFESPLGWLGQAVDKLVLKAYLKRFLEQRCAVIKQYAETDDWQKVLAGRKPVS